MTTATKQPRRIKIALVQMRCTGSKQDNVEKALARIAEAAAQGAELVCLQELFHGLYPCQSEDHARFAEAEPIPGPTSDALAAGRRPARRRGRRFAVRAPRRRACITTRRSCGTPTARCAACIARCTSPTIRCTTRSSTSRPAIWAFAASPRASDGSACASAGTSGSRKRPG